MSNEEKPEEDRTFFGVPLLVTDVLTLRTTSDATVFWFSGIKFSSLLLYGRIVGVQNTTSGFNYFMDDGTEIIKILPLTKRTNNIKQLEKEMLSYTHPNPEFVSSLKRIMEKIKEQTKTQLIKVGTKVLLFGIPDIVRNEICVKASDILTDPGPCSDLEITFKKILIDWYLENHL